MKYRRAAQVCIITAALLPVPATAGAPLAAERLLAEWRTASSTDFEPAAGQTLWFTVDTASGRQCTNCHTDDPGVTGRHQHTGKVIEPMAPSVNPARYTDERKIRKWLYRNCKWTFKRECTPQEKGDVLTWLLTQ